MENTIKLLAALAGPIRLKALSLLWDGKERCVCELMCLLGASQSRMSRHMNGLKNAGLVITRRDAQRVRYRRNPNLPAATIKMIDAILAAPKKRKKVK